MRYIDFVQLKHHPDSDEVVCEFLVERDVKSSLSLEEVIGGIAAESSIGTWTALTTEKAYVRKLAAKVFYVKRDGHNKAHIKIAYPSGLFELDNIPNFLSSVAGNIFGLRDIKNLKLIDMHFPPKMLAKFKGPVHGIEGIRKLMKIRDRPLVGTIIKPKLGLVTRDHANVAFNAWLGGCDIVKDDENLSSQSFNNFEERLKQTVKMKERAEKITGERKVYMINVTAETQEMLRRAKLVRKYGNEYMMVDVLTVGWSALQTLRNENKDLKLVMHAHRAGHAAFTKGDNGISMKVIAKLVRLIGVDQLHIGTIVGKMGESEEEVLANRSACVDKMGTLKKVFPVCSGGLQPGHVPALMKYFGKDVILQFGGGIHGHPNGTIAGAKAARQAVNAVRNGVTLKQYAVYHPELRVALEKWKGK